jgi:Ca-activated chloride channel family protein
MAEWLQSIGDFHFLRPWWFAGLIPVALILAIYQWRKRSAGNWETIINSQLLPFLMQGEDNNRTSANRRLMIAVISAWLLCCTSLAGPTWQQLPQPVHKQDSALVLIFDLSPSMLAQDITPSRLVRARFKLIDILKQRNEGFSALVVYGGEAHTVSPLTEDSNTIISLVPILHPSLLMEYGSNTEDAIDTAIKLAANGGYTQADLLLITDGVAASAFATIQSMLAAAGNYRLSILGVGTAQGAPIPYGNGSFVKDSSGAILIPKLDSPSLQRLASNAGGNYRELSADDRDIQQLLAGTEQLLPDATRELDRSFDLWDDQGFWLVILLLPILLLGFRKNILALLLLGPLLSQPQPAHASVWQDLWQTPDQQAAAALAAGDASAAQGLFKDSQWRASAAYRAGDYETAINHFKQTDSADGQYNLGNALAKAGDLGGAIEAYNQALAQQPDMEDALANRDLVEKLKQQQEQQQSSSDQEKNQEQEQNQQQQQNQDQQQSSDGQSSQNQQSNDKDQSQQDQQQPEQDDNQQSEQTQQSESEKQKSESESESEKQQAQQAQADDTLSDEEKQNQQEIEQMLRRVPDDPGGLLRQKFRYQSQQRALEQRRPKPPNEQERW